MWIDNDVRFDEPDEETLAELSDGKGEDEDDE